MDRVKQVNQKIESHLAQKAHLEDLAFIDILDRIGKLPSFDDVGRVCIGPSYHPTRPIDVSLYLEEGKPDSSTIRRIPFACIVLQRS